MLNIENKEDIQELGELWQALSQKAESLVTKYDEIMSNNRECSYVNLESINTTSFTAGFYYSGCSRGCCPSYSSSYDYPIELLWNPSYLETLQRKVDEEKAQKEAYDAEKRD